MEPHDRGLHCPVFASIPDPAPMHHLTAATHTDPTAAMTPRPATDDPKTSAHCPCPPTRRRTPLPVGGPRECKSIHIPVRLPSKFFGPRSKVHTSWVLTAHVLCYSLVKTHLATTGRLRAQGVQALNCRVASLLALTPSLRSVVLIPTYRTDCGPSPPS